MDEWTDDDLRGLASSALGMVTHATRHVGTDGIDIKVETKGKGDYVTSFDTGIEGELFESLPSEFCGRPVSFFGEEGTRRVEKSDLPYLAWVVDPIDGTSNMLHGLPSATSVALAIVDNNDERTFDTLIGIVLSHLDLTAHVAIKGQGAYAMTATSGRHAKRDDTAGAFAGVACDVHKVNVSKSRDGIGICGHPYDYERHGTASLAMFDVMSRNLDDVKRIGPSSLDACLVADGVASVYIEQGLTPYDTAASRLIVTEAGGYYGTDGDTFTFACSKDVAERIGSYVTDELGKMR